MERSLNGAQLTRLGLSTPFTHSIQVCCIRWDLFDIYLSGRSIICAVSFHAMPFMPLHVVANDNVSYLALYWVIFSHFYFILPYPPYLIPTLHYTRLPYPALLCIHSPHPPSLHSFISTHLTNPPLSRFTPVIAWPVYYCCPHFLLSPPTHLPLSVLHSIISFLFHPNSPLLLLDRR